MKEVCTQKLFHEIVHKGTAPDNVNLTYLVEL